MNDCWCLLPRSESKISICIFHASFAAHKHLCQLDYAQEDWAIEWPSANMTAIGGKDIGGNEADFSALHSMVDGRVEGMHLPSAMLHAPGLSSKDDIILSWSAVS